MIAAVIRWSARNIFLVGLASVFIGLAGIYALKHVPLDAIPDLSDVQVIIYTEYPGQAPQVVEDQVTYPLTTSMLSVPRSRLCEEHIRLGANRRQERPRRARVAERCGPCRTHARRAARHHRT